MHIINVTVRDKIATHVDGYYVCGNSDFVVHFDFDEEWAALDVKTARFICEDGSFRNQVFSGNECPVPIISNTNNIRVGVFAGNLCTTTPARVPAAKSILCPGGMPAAPEEDAYHQVMEEMAKVGHEARSSAEASAQSAQEAATSAQEAAQATKTAGTYLDNVDASAKAAAAAAQAAKQSETAAAASAESAEKAKADAVANADDAEAAAKAAKEWAGRSETFAGNAGTSADKAAASAQTAATSAEVSAASAKEAKDTATDILRGMQGDDGRGGLFLVGMNRNVSPVRLTRTYSEIAAAIDAGDTCLLCERGQAYLCRGYEKHPTTGETCIVFLGDTKFSDKYGAAPMYKYIAQDGTITESGTYVKSPNPQALTVKHGETTTTYNGAEQKYIDLTGIAGDAADIVIVKTKATNEGVYLADHGHAEIEEAISAGKLCLLLHGGTVYPYETFKTHDDKRCATFYGWADIREDAGATQVYAYIDSNRVVTVEGSFVKIPNPHALAIRKGETIMTYNGSEGVTVETLPTPADTASVAYSRWNGDAWEAVTIDQLKADLGLA